MKNNIFSIIVVALIASMILIKGSFFIINEGTQAIITEFGKPIGDPIITAGLHFKKPFIQKVLYVDKRILYWDGNPNQIPTKDKKYIKVDTTARWKIVNVLTFIQTVQNERGAKNRLDSILESTTRDIISNHNLVEVVRNSNIIIETVQAKKEALSKQKEDELTIDDEITGTIEHIQVGREAISKLIVEAADKALEKFGIKLIDVQLRRISYEKSVEQKVYERMISERKKIAEKIRSIGQGEKAKIEGRLIRDLKRIESEAYKKAQIIKGKGDAKATNIYAKSLNADVNFYEFIRTMEAYKESINKNTKLLFSSDSAFLKFLKK